MSLIARWRFEPGALTTDSSGNGNTLVLPGGNNDPDSVTSWRMEGQGSCYFHNIYWRYMTIADADLSVGFPMRHTDASPVMTFTFTFWFMAADTGTTRILFRKHPGTGNAYMNMWHRDNQQIWITIRSGTDATSHTVTHGTSISSAVPVFIAAGFNFSNKELFVRIRDKHANLVGTDLATAQTLTDGVIWTGTGAYQVGGISDANRAYGHLDDLRVFDTALTAAQVTQLCRQSSGQAGKRLMMGG